MVFSYLTNEQCTQCFFYVHSPISSRERLPLHLHTLQRYMSNSFTHYTTHTPLLSTLPTFVHTHPHSLVNYYYYFYLTRRSPELRSRYAVVTNPPVYNNGTKTSFRITRKWTTNPSWTTNPNRCMRSYTYTVHVQCTMYTSGERGGTNASEETVIS